MGLFSSKKVVSRSYDVIALKDATALQGDLWKNTKLQLFKAYKQNGIEGYNKTAWHMLHKIRKKFSTDYMVKAGVATKNDFTAYTYDRNKIEQALRKHYNDQSIVLTEYSDTAEITSVGDAQNVLGDLTNVTCTVENGSNTYSFIITNCDTNRTVVSEDSTNEQMLIITEDTMEIVPVPYAYANIQLSNVKGIMRANSVYNYLMNKHSGSFRWLNTASALVGTIEEGSLAYSRNVLNTNSLSDSITWNDGSITVVGVISNPTHIVNIIGTITGRAKANEDEVTTSSTTYDSSTASSSTTNTTVEETVDDNYYDEDINEESLNTDVGTFTSTCSIRGSRKTITTTVTEKTYTTGTREETTTDKDGNETTTTVSTVTETTTTTITTEYEPINYAINIQLEQPIMDCEPVINNKLIPTLNNEAYVNYKALDTDIISINDFKTVGTIHTSKNGFLDTERDIIDYDDDIKAILIDESYLLSNPELNVEYVDPEYRDLDPNTAGWDIIQHTHTYLLNSLFIKNPLEYMKVDTIAVTGKRANGTVVKAQIKIEDNFITEKNNYEQTPIITLRYAKKTLYSSTSAKTDKLKRILSPLGIDHKGVDNLIETVSSNANIYTASIVSGLRLFNEDNTLIQDSSHARAKVMFILAKMITGDGMALDTVRNYSIYNYTINTTYSYKIEKTTIPNFKDTVEYTELNLNNRCAKKYYMKAVEEQVGTYSYTTGGGEGTEVTHTMPITAMIVYVYHIEKTGTAVRYKFHNITMKITSADGNYIVSTSDKLNTNSWFNKVEKYKDLQKLVIGYPEIINKKLNIKEYSAIYNDNIYLFIYARKVTKVKWYQRGFFGFILIIATIAIMIAFPELGALKGFSGYLVTGLESMAIGYGLTIMLPNMSPWLRMILTIAITHGANTLAKSLEATTTGEVIKTVTIDSIIADIKTYIAKMSTLDKVLMSGNLITTGYQEYIKGEMEDAMQYTEKYIDMVSKATKKLDDKMREFDIQKDRVMIFADSMLDMVESEMYDEVEVSDVYMSVNFGSKMLAYVSSIDYQVDKLEVSNWNQTNIMI